MHDREVKVLTRKIVPHDPERVKVQNILSRMQKHRIHSYYVLRISETSCLNSFFRFSRSIPVSAAT